MEYIVVSTSKCKYQEWQLRLLKWSIDKVGQKGKLLLLMSEDHSHNNDLITTNWGENVEVIDLPDWANEWKKKHDDWWGGIPNKYESFGWLADKYPFKPNDRLLFLDPDMIFVKAIDLEPAENQIIGQTWIDYSPIPDWDFEGKAFMYPFALRANTLAVIKDDFKEFCFRIRKEVNRWESDMWALFYSAVNNNVNIDVKHHLGRCTVWQKPGDQSFSPIIHYPNVVKDSEGEKLFFKQDYTFKPEVEIKISSGKSKIDQLLLLNVTQERTDYLYYQKWGFKNVLNLYNGDKGHLIVQPWKGGFNNIRMSLEIGVCLAFLTNRILVLPSSYNMYLLKGKSDFSNYFDISDLGIKSISEEEFCKLKGIEKTEEEVKKISKVLDYDAVANVINFSKVKVPKKFTKWRKSINSEELYDDSEVIYLDKNLLGNFYQTLYTPFETEIKMIIAKYVRYRTDLFDIGWRFINQIGDLTYYSIHIRRNEFQYKELFISCEEILSNIIDVIPIHSKLYIATDHRDRNFFNPLKDKYKIIFYDDIAEELNLDKFDVNWIPIIEQLICTRSIKFVGTKFSTLSSYIYRIRGYMSDIDNTYYHINTEKFNPSVQCDFRESDDFIANWAREYADSWNFTKPRIFVSIAAYCDDQLIPTIIDCINQASDKNRICIGVHIQDDQDVLEKVRDLDIHNLKIIFTPKEESKGVVWARNRIKRELFDDEDYFLQIDAHSRFKKNWDNILLHQYDSIEEPNAVLTTYPNHFEISDESRQFLSLKNNAPLVVSKFISSNLKDNRLLPANLRSLKDYESKDMKWCSAGFVFAPASWVKDVVIPDNIVFNGEEDMMTHLSFLNGYHLKITSEACVWHNYNFKNDKTGEAYKEFNKNNIKDHSLRLINECLFAKNYSRTIEDLEDYLEVKFRPVIGYQKIYVSIPSFLDHDVKPTILDCIAKAKYPRNLVFGICWQCDFTSNAPESLLDDLIKKYNINIDIQHFQSSNGVGWARKKAAQFYDNEKYFLQIDAHTRFLKDWDAILINNYKEIKKASNRPIISYRPPSFQIDSVSDIEYENLENLHQMNYPEIISISDGCLFDYVDRNIRSTQNTSLTVPVLEPSFIFTDGRWANEVNQNEKIYFMGEDVDISLRSYLAGYDFFTPKQTVSWHRHSQQNHKKLYEIQSQNIVRENHDKSLNFLREYLRETANEQKGDSRSLSDYQNYSGVSFENQQVHQFKGQPEKTKIIPASSKSIDKHKYCILSIISMDQKEIFLNMLTSAQEAGVNMSLFRIGQIQNDLEYDSYEYILKKLSFILECLKSNYRTVLWTDYDFYFENDVFHELNCYKDHFTMIDNSSQPSTGFWQIQSNDKTIAFLEAIIDEIENDKSRETNDQIGFNKVNKSNKHNCSIRVLPSEQYTYNDLNLNEKINGDSMVIKNNHIEIIKKIEWFKTHDKWDPQEEILKKVQLIKLK